MTRKSLDTTGDTIDRGRVNRRRVLQGVAVAGAGLVGTGTVGAATDDHEDEEREKRGTVTFAASAVTHRIDFPSDEVRANSLVAVNTLPEHAIFEDDGILSYTHHTTRETARLLEENPAGLWYENYRGLPVSDARPTRNVWIGVDAIDHPRVTKGALIEGTYRPPGFNMSQRGETVRVAVGSEQTEVAPGERFRQELPTRKLNIRVSRPAEGTNDDSEEQSRDGGGNRGRGSGGGRTKTVEQLEVRPTLNVTNYGEVEIRAPEGWTPRERETPNKEVADQ